MGLLISFADTIVVSAYVRVVEFLYLSARTTPKSKQTSPVLDEPSGYVPIYAAYKGHRSKLVQRGIEFHESHLAKSSSAIAAFRGCNQLECSLICSCFGTCLRAVRS